MKIVYADYKRSLVNLSNSILNYFTGIKYHNTIEEIDKLLNDNNYDNIILFLYDGLGSNILKNKLNPEDFLVKNKLINITSVFPATTTAATTSLITGLNPIEHGWLGWNNYVKEIDKIVTMYWNVVKDTEIPAADFNVAKKYFPYSTIMDKINESSNANAYWVSPYDGIKYDVNNVDEMYQKVSELCNRTGKKFIYAYYNEPDSLMHEYGVYNNKVELKIKELNYKTEQFCSKLKNSLVIVTADHGHMDVDYIVLSDYHHIKEMLIMETSLEKRATTYFVKPGMQKEFESEFKKEFSNDFILLSKKEIIERKLFGDGIEHEWFDSCIGDFVSLAISNKGIADKKEDSPLKSTHAGITEDEVVVPVIISKCMN